MSTYTERARAAGFVVKTSTRSASWRLLAGAMAVMLLASASMACRADTVASLLGNFTINQFCGIRLDQREAKVRYTVVFGQLPALRELHAADTDGDGVTSEAERDAYARRLAPDIGEQLVLGVDGKAVPLRAVHWAASLPTEQGGFSLRLDIDFVGELALPPDDETHTLAFANRNYAGRFGWQEIVVEPSRVLAIFDTNAFSTSLTSGLTEAVQAIPVTGPLAERSVQASLRRGSAPPGSMSLQPRTGTQTPVELANAPPSDDAAKPWIRRATRRLIDSISSPAVPLGTALLALLGAALLGALHAFSPGHGKTVVGAYLIGSRATARHAVFLGATVTVTHTIGVFALGFVTLFASRFILPERLFPILSLISGLLVIGIGALLFQQRLRGLRDAFASASRIRYRKINAAASAVRLTPFGVAGRMTHGGAFALAHHHVHAAHDHHHGDHQHAHLHVHAHGGGLTHSHGGALHTHLPPEALGERVTWKSLLALGVSGGLVPCPSAMVLLLAAVALNKTVYGLALVLAFSVGLAATLTAVGLIFLYGRRRFSAARASARWLQWTPIASAAAITLVGALMCYATLTTWPS